jgi:hypothetical protein
MVALVGAAPMVQLELASEPGVIVIWHDEEAAITLPQFVEAVVPAGQVGNAIETPVAAIVPVFVMAICLDVPVNWVLCMLVQLLDGRQFTDNAKLTTLGVNVVCANVTSRVWLAVILESVKTSPPICTGVPSNNH